MVHCDPNTDPAAWKGTQAASWLNVDVRKEVQQLLLLQSISLKL
jgi:hypothetical protein